jgi:hypothetical protein
VLPVQFGASVLLTIGASNALSATVGAF